MSVSSWLRREQNNQLVILRGWQPCPAAIATPHTHTPGGWRYPAPVAQSDWVLMHLAVAIASIDRMTASPIHCIHWVILRVRV